MLSASILFCCFVNTVATTGTGPVAMIASIVIIVLLLGCVPVIVIAVVVIYRYVWQIYWYIYRCMFGTMAPLVKIVCLITV